MIVGPTAVGKTAVAEGFALRIAAGDVPPALRDVALRTLDVGLLQAGASMKGEFENRLRQVIDEVQSSDGIEQIAVIREGQPGMKGHERRNERETGGAIRFKQSPRGRGEVLTTKAS